MVSYCLTNYTVQCRDAKSGKTGCFLFDVTHWQATGEFMAVSDVFPCLISFYAGTLPSQRIGKYIERNAA